MSKSSLRKLHFKLTQAEKSDLRLPSLKKVHKIRFLSRGNALSALMKNVVPMLTYFKVAGGQVAVNQDIARRLQEEADLDREAEPSRVALTSLRASINALADSRDICMRDAPADQKQVLWDKCENGEPSLVFRYALLQGTSNLSS